MSEVVDYVVKIVDRGLAYEANGSVYFDTVAFREAGHRYGKLCPWAVGTAELAAESEANFTTSEKKNSSDFALWKVRAEERGAIPEVFKKCADVRMGRNMQFLQRREYFWTGLSARAGSAVRVHRGRLAKEAASLVFVVIHFRVKGS